QERPVVQTGDNGGLLGSITLEYGEAAVVTGLDHGPLLVVGPGGGIGVGLMGVAVEDRVDLGGGLVDDLVEDGIGVRRRLAGGPAAAGTLVVGGDDDVVVLAGVLQLGHSLVERVDRVAEL